MQNRTLPFVVPFECEKDFQLLPTILWMRENWTHGFLYIGVYLVLVFGIQKFMKHREPLSLRYSLGIWSGLLAIFSIIGTLRTITELWYILNDQGLYYSICQINVIEEKDPVTAFWGWLFSLSKVPELGDTIFIVLRKKPLIFLHWYHHITVLLYTWFSYTEYIASARYYVVINYFVHSIMYSYYSITAFKIRLSKRFAMFITLCQIFQMMLGIFINLKTLQFLREGLACSTSNLNLGLSLLMYLSYFVLFSRLYYVSYLSRSVKKKGV